MSKRIITLFLGLALLVPAAQAQKKLTWRDCAKVFTWANAVEKTRMLDSRQCGEAWRLSYARDGEDEFLGYVFASEISDAGKKLDLLVGIDDEGAISKVIIKGNNDVDKDFLAQFQGRNANSSFDIARTEEDLLTVPNMLKTMRDKKELSLAIIKEVASIVAVASEQSGVTPTP